MNSLIKTSQLNDENKSVIVECFSSVFYCFEFESI